MITHNNLKTQPSRKQIGTRQPRYRSQLSRIEPQAEPQTSSRYTNEIRIGEGGTAMIYKAYDTRLKREVALKRYKEELSQDYTWEIETASRIHHHNVITTHDANTDENGQFMVMEYIDGSDLNALVSDSPMEMERFCDFCVQALEGLSATHKGGLLHLDLKPDNIMISREGGCRDHVKLIDFGRARLSLDPETKNVPKGSGLNSSIYFASPEYLKEEPVDCRSDLYSLGCTFYWALSQEFPFNGPNSLMVMNAHLQHYVEDLSKVAPHLPRKLTSWVMSLIKESPNQRPQSADEALDSFFRRRLATIQPSAH